MDKIKDYAIVTGDSPSQLEELVKQNLKEGWEPFGNLFLAQCASGSYMCQAMVIYKRGGPA